MASFDQNTTGTEVVAKYGSEATGKTILITGPSKGSLGAQAAVDLASAKPACVLLVGRSESKIQPVIDDIKSVNSSIDARFVQADFSDIETVRAAGAKINAMISKIDIVINSAGVMATPEYSKTKDGFEYQLAACHVGHFLLTNLIMDKIIAAQGRIVNLTSMGYELHEFRFNDYNFSEGREYNPWYGYGQAKTANVLFTMGLKEKLASKGVTSVVLHPGLILATGILGGLTEEMFGEGFKIATERNGGVPPEAEMQKSTDQGAATILCAALDPSLKSGTMLKDSQPFDAIKDYASSPANADKLWTLSEGMVGETFVY